MARSVVDLYGRFNRNLLRSSVMIASVLESGRVDVGEDTVRFRTHSGSRFTGEGTLEFIISYSDYGETGEFGIDTGTAVEGCDIFASVEFVGVSSEIASDPYHFGLELLEVLSEIKFPIYCIVYDDELVGVVNEGNVFPVPPGTPIDSPIAVDKKASGLAIDSEDAYSFEIDGGSACSIRVGGDSLYLSSCVEGGSGPEWRVGKGLSPLDLEGLVRELIRQGVKGRGVTKFPLPSDKLWGERESEFTVLCQASNEEMRITSSGGGSTVLQGEDARTPGKLGDAIAAMIGD